MTRIQRIIATGIGGGVSPSLTVNSPCIDFRTAYRGSIRSLNRACDGFTRFAQGDGAEILFSTVAGINTESINSKEISQKSFFSFYKDGFLVAGTSPKAWMFFPFIFPQFIDFNENYIAQFIILLTTYVILDFLSLIGYALLANKLIVWIKANPKVINTISACVLIIIAIIIALTQQY